MEFQVAKSNKSKASRSNPPLTKQSLLEENERLREELTILRAEHQARPASKKRRSSRFLKTTGLILFTILAILSLFALNLSFWLKNTVTNTDNFVATTQPLLRNEEVNKALTAGISEEIFRNVNVQQLLNDNLPENVNFLAAPLAGQIESFTTSRISQLLASQKAEDIWTTVLRQGHSQIIAYLNNEQTNGEITVNELYKFAGNELSQSNVSFLFNKSLPPKVGNIQVAEVKWVPEAKTYLRAIERIPQLLSLLFIIFVALSVLLAKNRKKTLLTLSIVAGLTMVLSLVLISLGSKEISSLAQSQNKAAAEQVYSILTTSLVNQTKGLLWLFLSGAIGMFLLSNYGWLVKTKAFIRNQLDTLSLKILTNFQPPVWLVKINKSRFIIQFTSVVIFYLAFALRLPPTKNGVINAIIASAIGIIIIELVATLGRINQSGRQHLID